MADALQAPYHTVMVQLVRMLSMVPLFKVHMMGGRGSGSSEFAEGSRDAVVLSWPVLQCCWSRRGPL